MSHEGIGDRLRPVKPKTKPNTSFVTFEKLEDQEFEYNVIGKNKLPVAVIVKPGAVFKRRVVLTGIDFDTEFTSECLKEIVTFMESFEIQ